MGKYDLSLRLSFLLHFWNKLSENNNFDVKTVRKFLILREKIFFLFLLATTSPEPRMGDSQAVKWIQVASRYRTDVVILVSVVLDVLIKNIEVSDLRDLSEIPT